MVEEYSRPDPEKLLEKIQAEQNRQKQGRLKIFLGYAAGVGKTFAMLEAAHQRLAEGMDVVVGYVETHGRVETEALLQSLEIIPRAHVEYHGAQLKEMDIDAVLARHPALVLVDELAHTNAPGFRHPKRFQDVEELLENGINVYTTLNIQHLESLNDVVQQITGVKIRETIPDHVIEQATEIEVIDLPPDELLERLKAGKVYLPDQAARASHSFFRKGNLTALREIALRNAARRVDTQMLDYMETKSIPGPWPAREHILVAISSHPMSEKLVRTGRRLADNLEAEWVVAYVETPERLKYSPVHSENVARTMRLAEELGAKVITLTGNTAPGALLEYAHKHNITKIVAGKPLRPRWLESLRGSPLDEIIRGSGSIDVYVISEPGGPMQTRSLEQWRPHRSYQRYLYSMVVILLITLVSLPFQSLFHPVNLVMLFLAGVVVSALYFGRGPSILASVLGVLAFDFFFIEPRLSFSVSDTQYVITFASLLVVGLVISSLTARVRDQVEAIQRRQEQTRTLYSLSRDLATVNGLETLLTTIVDHVCQTFQGKVVIFLRKSGKLELTGASADFILDENENAIATWSFEHGQPTGQGTDTLPAAQIRVQPLKTPRGTLGVLGVQSEQANIFTNPEQRQLLEAYTSLAAVAIERVLLDEQSREAQLLRESERLQNALLNSISHDLRTPLAAISGALESIREAEQAGAGQIELDPAAKMELIDTAREETQRLNRLVGNLLDMTRLEAGAMKLNTAQTDIQELVSTALSHLRERLSGHPIRVQIPETLPAISLDMIFMEQVLTNLLDNAIKYSPAGAPIDLQVRVEGSVLVFRVADRGVGIAPENLERIFDKFFRIEQMNSVHGTGLGLSICKGIVEAHGGRIWAENHPEGGAVISFTLPLEPISDPHEEGNYAG